MEHDRFVYLASVGDLITGRICAALLEATGIPVRLHGESLGPYPVTVGQMAVTEIWVGEADLEEAREVMLEAEIDHMLGEEMRGGALADPGSLPMRLLALIVAGVLGVAVVVTLMRVF